MNTSLTLPSKIKNSTPKPSKSQLVEALMLRAMKNHKEKEEIKEKKRLQLEAEGVELVLGLVKDITPTLKDVTFGVSYHTSHKSPVVSIGVTSPQIKAIQRKISDLSWSRFDSDATKKMILEKLKTPNPLLNNESVEKSLDQLLATIMNSSKIEAIEV
jgi:hypothetical protein